MSKPDQGVANGNLTVEQALAMRTEQARLAAHYADHVEQARAAAQYEAMRHWMHQYRRATRQCRLLGERIRNERAVPAQRAVQGDLTVVRLAPRSAIDIPPTGEAA